MKYTILIPLTSTLVMILGGYLTRLNKGWYATIIKPRLTPPAWVFSVAWTLIAITATISAFIAYKKVKNSADRRLILGLFILNALLNNLWTYLFFVLHQPAIALLDAIALTLVTWALIVLLRRTSMAATLLLLPYGLWLLWALYLNYGIILLN